MTMLDSLKHTRKSLGHEIAQAWENLSEGWRELLSRSNNALTHFKRNKDETTAQDPSTQDGALAMFPRWGLLAGEMEETKNEVLVRVELPGLDKEDCRISMEDNIMHLSGEKRVERETYDSTFHVIERAYGIFARHIVLPRNVDTERAQATFKNGVLTVRLPKTSTESAKSIPVT